MNINHPTQYTQKQRTLASTFVAVDAIYFFYMRDTSAHKPTKKITYIDTAKKNIGENSEKPMLKNPCTI
jgi:hypothetical protein